MNKKEERSMRNKKGVRAECEEQNMTVLCSNTL